MKDHRQIDQRSLAFAREIASRLVAEPQLIGRARANVLNWMQTCSPRARPALLEWLAVLDGPVDGVIAVLTGSDECCTRLRQSNPFAGVLTPRERDEILSRFDSHDPATA